MQWSLVFTFSSKKKKLRVLIVLEFLEWSVDGDEDVLPDTASGEKSDSERVILQVALRFTRLFPFSIAGQRDHPRSILNCILYLWHVIIVNVCSTSSIIYLG